ncbi:MAG TPA: thymidine phosphorylase [Polyangiaceae bacterium]|nr:thymidine phosphorylase [Polyangiaceae bacterium]
MSSAVELIQKKRDGGELTASEVAQLVGGLLSGEIADYQLSAFLMATYFRGMTPRETIALTEAMLHSGKVLHLRSVTRPKVDKHSTGGVGDKISIPLAPLVASCGAAVPMVSGRGLGHTGGTLDKLESIPGFRVNLTASTFERIVREVGTAMIGQTAEIAPADRRLYALRDVTATVESIPLIVASILSKKLAEGIDALVLDVKAGRGAFMKDVKSARELARALVAVGKRAEKRVAALVTDMSNPIGLTIGNALEVRESIEILQNRGPADTRELTLELGVEMLRTAGVERSSARAKGLLENALADGSAFECFCRMVRAQKGDVRAVERPERLPRAKFELAVAAPRSGVVQAIDALELGLCSVSLGAGRARAEDDVDPGAGIRINAPIGTRVARGEPLAFLYASTRARAEATAERAGAAFRLAPRAKKPEPRVLERVGSGRS